jgi:hypothetical protein
MIRDPELERILATMPVEIAEAARRHCSIECPNCAAPAGYRCFDLFDPEFIAHDERILETTGQS